MYWAKEIFFLSFPFRQKVEVEKEKIYFRHFLGDDDAIKAIGGQGEKTCWTNIKDLFA